MKKQILSTLFLLTFFSFAFAQKAPSIDEGKSLLWKIQGKGVKKASYLFGTVHLIEKKHFVLTEATQKAFKKTKRVAFEMNLKEMNNFSAVVPALLRAFMRDGTTLEKLLSKEDYALVNQHFLNIGIPDQILPMIKWVKPMFLAMLPDDMLSMEGGMETGEMLSYEFELMEIADELKMKVAGLETLEDQLGVFDSIPYDIQAEMLMETIRGEGMESDQAMDDMIQLYKEQDIEGLYNLIHGESEESGVFENAILVNRNKNWIPVMAKMMKDKPTFFAVGAGHLGGDVGVIALLKEAGYKVQPIK